MNDAVNPRRSFLRNLALVITTAFMTRTQSTAIETCRGERIGYVPRNWIDAIERSGRRAGRVLYANPYALPWRRYRIELT
jgi:hypothetical protein